jgi:hypothetical protein
VAVTTVPQRAPKAPTCRPARIPTYPSERPLRGGRRLQDVCVKRATVSGTRDLRLGIAYLQEFSRQYARSFQSAQVVVGQNCWLRDAVWDMVPPGGTAALWGKSLSARISNPGVGQASPDSRGRNKDQEFSHERIVGNPIVRSAMSHRSKRSSTAPRRAGCLCRKQQLDELLSSMSSSYLLSAQCEARDVERQMPVRGRRQV